MLSRPACFSSMPRSACSLPQVACSSQQRLASTEPASELSRRVSLERPADLGNRSRVSLPGEERLREWSSCCPGQVTL